MTRRSELDEVLRKVISVAESCNFTRGMASPYRSILKEWKRNRLRIGVLGITSSGKSAFLNALCGVELLPEQSRATTNMLVYCRHRHGAPQIEVYFQDGRPRKTYTGSMVSASLVKSLCSEDHNSRNCKGVSALALYSPKMRVDDRFELVDTPGLDAFGLEYHEELTLRKFLPEADIVIYMTSIRNPLKKADLRVLNEIVQHDQRVLFVQSMIDVERDDTMLGFKVVESRQQKLKKHLERLKHDVSEHASGLKAWHYVQVSSKWAKRSETFEQSGFPNLIESIALFGKDLRVLMGERLATRARYILQQHLDAVTQMIHEIEGETKQAEETAAIRAQRQKRLEDCRSEIETTIESTFHKWQLQVSGSVLEEHVKENLDVHSSDEDFESARANEKSYLNALQRQLVVGLDEVERSCRMILEGVGLTPAREAVRFQTNSNSGPSLAMKWVTETVYERRWYTLWLYEHAKEIQVKRVDKEKSNADLISYAKEKAKELDNHLGWWREHCKGSYVAPVKNEMNDHELATQMILSSSRQDSASLRRLVDVLEQAAKDLQRPDNRGQEPVAHSFPESPQEPCSQPHLHPLQKLVEGYRELTFHRTLLSMVNEATDQGPPPVLLVLANQGEDLKKMVSLLRHDPHRWLEGPVLSSCVIFCRPGHDVRCLLQAGRSSRGKICREEAKSIWDRLTLVLLQAKGVHNGDVDLDQLLEKADSVCLMVNCSQVSHSVKEMWETSWCEALYNHREKVFFADLSMRFFDASRMHEIVTQALDELWKQGPYGRRPVLLTDGYDCRYTELARISCDLLPVVRNGDDASARSTARRALQEWQTRGQSTRPPFTKKELNNVFGSIFSSGVTLPPETRQHG